MGITYLHLGLSMLTYEPIELRNILTNYQLNKDFRFKKLSIDAIKEIRRLKLNCKRRRHRYTAQKRQAQHDHGKGPRLENLTKIKRKGYKENTNIILGTINVQSIRNKDLQVSELLENYDLDILVLTETWLTNSDTDKQWLENTQLNRHPYNLLQKNRPNGKGGGLALITKNCYPAKTIDSWEHTHPSNMLHGK